MTSRLRKPAIAAATPLRLPTAIKRDWWGDSWNRVGGILGEQDDDDRPRRDHDIDNRRRDMERESRRHEDEIRARERAVQDFLRERSERLRREARGQRNNGRRNN